MRRLRRRTKAQRCCGINHSGTHGVVDSPCGGVCACRQPGGDLAGCFVGVARTHQRGDPADVGGGEGRATHRGQLARFAHGIDQPATSRTERFHPGARSGDRNPRTCQGFGYRIAGRGGVADRQDIAEPAGDRDGLDIVPIARVGRASRVDFRILFATRGTRVTRTGDNQGAADVHRVADGGREHGLIDSQIRRETARHRNRDDLSTQIRRMRYRPCQGADVQSCLLSLIDARATLGRAEGTRSAAQRDDMGIGGHTGEPVGGIRCRTDDSSDQRAVRVTIGQPIAACLHIVPGAGQIGQSRIRTHTRVDHRHRDAATPAQRAGTLQIQCTLRLWCLCQITVRQHSDSKTALVLFGGSLRARRIVGGKGADDDLGRLHRQRGSSGPGEKHADSQSDTASTAKRPCPARHQIARIAV